MRIKIKIAYEAAKRRISIAELFIKAMIKSYKHFNMMHDESSSIAVSSEEAEEENPGLKRGKLFFKQERFHRALTKRARANFQSICKLKGMKARLKFNRLRYE